MILRLIIGPAPGGGPGFAYYKFAGCATDTCPLTSNPRISTICRGLPGALPATHFK